MCMDNPREEFSDLFATHPPIEQRIQAIIKFAGGHDPGPLALPEPGDAQAAPPAGPWSGTGGQTGPAAGGPLLPFLRPLPPGRPGGGSPAAEEAGPWGPHEPS
jgi:heat shock protein HtpX